jgi:hypothetical protein
MAPTNSTSSPAAAVARLRSRGISTGPGASVGDWELMGAADFNGDGRADLLFRRASDGALGSDRERLLQTAAADSARRVGPRPEGRWQYIE